MIDEIIEAYRDDDFIVTKSADFEWMKLYIENANSESKQPVCGAHEKIIFLNTPGITNLPKHACINRNKAYRKLQGHFIGKSLESISIGRGPENHVKFPQKLWNDTRPQEINCPHSSIKIFCGKQKKGIQGWISKASTNDRKHLSRPFKQPLLIIGFTTLGLPLNFLSLSAEQLKKNESFYCHPCF